MVIKFFGVLTCVVMAGLSVSACSSDSGGSDPVSKCKELAAATCEKYYNCFSEEELTAASAGVGNNKADCVDKQGSQCNADSAKCDSGEAFHSDKADACISGFQAFSCDEFRGLGTTTQSPAACDQVCSK